MPRPGDQHCKISTATGHRPAGSLLVRPIRPAGILPCRTNRWPGRLYKEIPVSTNSASVAWLTQESYDRLKAELDHLSGPGRTEIVARIEQARSEGDLKENGGYHAAKEEQGKAEYKGFLKYSDHLRS